MSERILFIFMVTAFVVVREQQRDIEKQIRAVEQKISEYKALKCEWPTDYSWAPWEYDHEMEDE